MWPMNEYVLNAFQRGIKIFDNLKITEGVINETVNKKERNEGNKVHLHFSQLIYFQKYKMGMNVSRF